MEEFAGSQKHFEKGVLLEGWRGRSIRVMQDKWIPNYHTNQVLHRTLDAEEDWSVCELLDGDGHGWDRGLVGVKFHREDAKAILRIPLSHRNIPDSIVWLPIKMGNTRSSRVTLLQGSWKVSWMEGWRVQA